MLTKDYFSLLFFSNLATYFFPRSEDLFFLRKKKNHVTRLKAKDIKNTFRVSHNSSKFPTARPEPLNFERLPRPDNEPARY